MACVADPFDESEGIAEIFELWRSRLVVPHAGGPDLRMKAPMASMQSALVLICSANC